MVANSTQSCYQYDRGTRQTWAYTPCNLGAESSMCCRTFQVGNGTPDYCLPNGLCANVQLDNNNKISRQTFWLESCSDQSWESEACAPFVKYVKSGSGCFIDAYGNVPLGFCAETNKYCCNQGIANTNCCDISVSGNMVVDVPVASIVASTRVFSSTTSTLLLPTLHAASSTTNSAGGATAPPSSPSSSSSSSNSLSAGAGVGIGIAASVGVALIVLALLFFCMRRRRNQGVKAGSLEEDVAAPRYADSEGKSLGVKPYQQPQELGYTSELNGNIRRELPDATFGAGRHELS